MRAWLFVGGGVVIVAAIAIAFWGGEQPTPDPAARDAASEAPAVSDEPTGPADQDQAEMAPEEEGTEASADQSAAAEPPVADVDQTADTASPEAQPAEQDGVAEHSAGDQLADTETPARQLEGDGATAEAVPDQVAETVEQPPVGAAPGAQEADEGPSVVERSDGQPDETGETESVAAEASSATDTPVVERSDETETVADAASPATETLAPEPQSDATHAADQGTAASDETAETAERPETVAEQPSDVAGAQPAETPAAVPEEATAGPVADAIPSGEAVEAQEQPGQLAALPTTEPPPVEQSTPGEGDATATVDQPAPTPATDTVELDIGPEAPSFDAVRVNENGMIIVAGRAEPGATVVITDNGEPIGTVEADDLGEFVFIGLQPLSPGDHEIGLEAFMADDPETVLSSSRVVLLVVPETGLTVADTAPAQDGAGDGSVGGDTGVLAILVDRDEVAPTEVLQAPQAPTIETTETETETETEAGAGAGPSDERPSAVDEVPANAQAPDTVAPLVSIDVVDYDDDGRLIIAGRAVAGAIIIIYLDNRPIGQALAAADGRYWLRPDEPVAPGLYTLRADHVGDDGAVVARAETPFQRTAPLANIPDNRQIIVQPGNNLWRLARRIYGQGLQYTVIYQANRDQIRNPDLIYPGQVFELPAPPQRLPAGVPSRI